MSTVTIVLLVILVILIAALIGLYFFGKKAQKKQEEQQAQIEATKQTVSMLVIDKKRMPLKESGLPQMVIEQTPKLMRRSKLPIVKAKIGPKIAIMIADEKVFDLIPLKKEIKAEVSGLYIVGVKGTVFTTKTGEISVHASEFTLLSKSLQVLPEKFHGLTDTDMRYRQRYVDLIMNAEVKDTFVKRSKILAAIRKYLGGEGFMEVETPMLVANAGGAAARPFETHFNALNEDLKLRISLELYLKRLIVGGLERVYEIGRVFRNEGLDTRHNPEFTLMELYQAYTDYYGMMDLTENMFRYVAQEVCGTTVIPYAEETIDLGKPFERLTMVDAVKKYAGVDFDQIPDTAAAKKLADEKGVHYEERHAKGDILNLFFEEFVEEHLIQPVFIMDHPVEISPLTKRKPDKPDYVERFELFIYGREMCNAYSELNDPIDQRERFKAQEAALAAGDEEANTTDEDFMNALEIGMPPTGGIGFGIDRMCMLLTNSAAIRDVLLFPTMKSLDADKKSAKSENSTSTAAPEKEEVIDFSKVKVEPLFEEFVDFDTFSKSDFRAVKVKACEAVKKSKKLYS